MVIRPTISVRQVSILFRVSTSKLCRSSSLGGEPLARMKYVQALQSWWSVNLPQTNSGQGMIRSVNNWRCRTNRITRRKQHTISNMKLLVLPETRAAAAFGRSEEHTSEL